MNNNRRIIFFGLSLFFIFNSCGIYDGYYHKVKNNKADFSSAVDYIMSERLFELKDSINKQKNVIHNFNSVSLYREDMKDSLLISFMKKYDIDRITMDKRQDKFYNNVIIFHKNYNPILGSSKRINYDFGSSPIRDSLELEKKKVGGCTYKIIDNNFIYCINKRPSFGE